jgi:Raf kinase inhibitor-like YbhB/YbcL family protein
MTRIEPGNVVGESALTESIRPIRGQIVQGRIAAPPASWERSGYGGPCPPSGTHRYLFKLYAVDRALDLEAGITAADLTRALEWHDLAEAVLMGRYARTRRR